MNYIIEALKKYAVFSGRARRKEFWFFVLVFGVTYFVLQAICCNMEKTEMIILIVYILAILLPAIAVGIRRAHDIGRSGWWMLVNLIPIIGSIWYLILMIEDSQQGDNLYGPCPK